MHTNIKKLLYLNSINTLYFTQIDMSKVGATTISSHFLTDSHGDLYTMATEIFTSAHYTVVKVPAGDTKKRQ